MTFGILKLEFFKYMAYACFNCGKRTVKGTQHRHKPGVAGRQHLRRAPHTPKDFVPNLHNAFVLENGRTQKVLLCTKCRRMLKDLGMIKVWTKEAPTVPAVKEIKKIEKKEEIKPVEKKVVKKAEKVKAKVKVKPVVPAMSIEDLVGKKK